MWAETQPHITVDRKEIQFGSLKLTRQIEASEAIVKVRNDGDKLLQISRVDSGCGCIRAKLLDKAEIPPGSETRLKVWIELSHISFGDQRTAIYVASNDPLTPLQKITVGYAYEPDIRISAPEILLSSSSGSHDFLARGSVQLIDNGAEPLRILAVKSSIPDLKHEIFDTSHTDISGRTVHYVTVHIFVPFGVGHWRKKRSAPAQNKPQGLPHNRPQGAWDHQRSSENLSRDRAIARNERG